MRADRFRKSRTGFGLPGMLVATALFVSVAAGLGWSLNIVVGAATGLVDRDDSGSRKAAVKSVRNEPIYLQ